MLALNHPFIEETATNTPVTPAGGIDVVYFTKREKDMAHIFWRGRTENIMDYNHGYEYNSAVKALTNYRNNYTATSSTNSFIEYTIEYKAMCFQQDSSYFNALNDRISFWQWQWRVMQKDDEIITKTETV